MHAHAPLDRRAARRWRVEIAIRLFTEHLEVEGCLEDASESGVFVASEYLEEPGSPVQLALFIDRHVCVWLAGHVAWVRTAGPRPGMGIALAHPMRAWSFAR